MKWDFFSNSYKTVFFVSEIGFGDGPGMHQGGHQ